MIEIKKHKKMDDLEQVWKGLYNSCPSIVPMAEYEFVIMFNGGLVSKLSSFLNKKSKNVYYEVLDNNETVLILPCVIENNEIVSMYTLDYYDCIFKNDISAEKMFEYLKTISRFENKKLKMLRLKNDGATYGKLKNLVKFEDCNECVKINFSKDYEEYYSSLSKSARQNLRTAYNRANTDNLKFEFDIHFGKTSKKVQNQLNKIYLNRRASRYNNMSFIKKVLFKISDRIADVCFGLNSSFHACLSLNNTPVAFMAGLVNGKELIVPRLAINDKYSRYSLGIVLVNETIKVIQQKGFTCLDLSAGTETYKFQMGGQSHICYSLTIGENDEQQENEL